MLRPEGYQNGLPDEVRFWALVDKQGPTQPHMRSRCWVWTAYRNAQGYGRFTATSYLWRTTLGLTTRLAHRLSWFIAHGALPPGLICHRCDNPCCVRPSHLRKGTHASNVQDKMQKGRWRGRPHAADQTTAAAIRRAYKAGSSQAVLALRFGLAQRSISKIVNRRGIYA